MEEEIDLRPYLRALRRRWWWIAGAALAFMVIAYVVSTRLPVLYEASSLVLVTQPRYQIQFDPRFATTQQPNPPYKVFAKLATSDQLLQAVVDGYQAEPEAPAASLDLPRLSGMAKVTSAADPSLLVLQVRAGSPQTAAAIANLWTDVLVKKGNVLYSDTAQDIDMLKGQVADAGQALDAANTALVDLQSRNQLQTLKAQLDSQEQAQKAYLSTQITVTDVLRDAQAIRSQWANQPAGQPFSLADSLTMLLLQIKAFNSGAALPIQLQINSGEALSGMSKQQQIAFLDNLITTLQNRSTDSIAKLAALEPAILALQRKHQEAQVQFDDLTRRQKLAEETYLTVARKLSEAQITAQTGNGTLRVANYALAPQRPVSPKPLRNAALAGLVGAFLGVLAVLAVEWWQR